MRGQVKRVNRIAPTSRWVRQARRQYPGHSGLSGLKCSMHGLHAAGKTVFPGRRSPAPGGSPAVFPGQWSPAPGGSPAVFPGRWSPAPGGSSAVFPGRWSPAPDGLSEARTARMDLPAATSERVRPCVMRRKRQRRRAVRAVLSAVWSQRHSRRSGNNYTKEPSLLSDVTSPASSL